MDYIAVFVANGFYRNRTEFLREHVVFSSWAKFPKVERYVNTAKLLRLKSLVLVHMPYKKYTERIKTDVKVGFALNRYQSALRDRWDVYNNLPVRNGSQMVHVLRRLVNSDSTRLREVRRIVEEKKKVIIFYNFDYELEILRGLKNCTNVAEWNGHKHEEIPDKDFWVYLVQYAAGSEGWNCIETDTMVFYSLPYSYKHFHQAHGRIDRLNVPFLKLFYFYLISDSKIDQMIALSLKKKRSFNEKKLIDFYEKGQK